MDNPHHQQLDHLIAATAVLEKAMHLLTIVRQLSHRMTELEQTLALLIRQNQVIENVLHGHQAAFEAFLTAEGKPRTKRTVN